MNINKYKDLVINLVASGADFSKDVFCRNSGANSGFDWNQLATDYGYRKPKDGYFCKGGHFYQLLQRVYNKLKSDNDFINSVANRTRNKTVFGIK